MSGFLWKNLERPFFCLAPMADVTDAAFRRMFAKYGKPNVIWTEFVSADGLMSKGKEHLLKDLCYDESERPIIAQLFGANIAKMEGAARLIKELKFDGLDINMGCPAAEIEKTGCGSAMIKNPNLAKEIIAAAKAGADPLPVSVKTRLGYSENEIETWLPCLIEVGVEVITIHARTRNEMSKVPARWEEIKRAVEIAREMKREDRPLIIGNGDVKSLEQGRELAKETGCDGIMIGRGAFGAPWFFKDGPVPPPQKVIEVLIEHIKLFDELYKDIKSFEVMKKHFKAYLNGFPGAFELRMKLMAVKNAKEAILFLRACS